MFVTKGCNVQIQVAWHRLQMAHLRQVSREEGYEGFTCILRDAVQ